jgi:hypothetical protein
MKIKRREDCSNSNTENEKNGANIRISRDKVAESRTRW